MNDVRSCLTIPSKSQHICTLENDFTFTIFDFVNNSSEQCSKTNTKKYILRMRRFFSWAQSMNNAAENCKKKIADFLVGSKYEKLCKFTRNVV